MNDLYGLEASGLPPELIAQLAGNSRRRAIAEAMLKQSMEMPRAAPVKGRFQGVVSPLEHVAKLVQSVMANRDMRSADAERSAIAGQAETGRKAAMEAYMRQKMGAPGVTPATAVDDEGNAMPSSPGVKEDPRGALAAGFADPYLQNSKFLQMEYSDLSRNEDREDRQRQRQDDLRFAAEEKIRQIQEQAAQGRITKDEADARHAELMKALKGMGGGATPFFQAVSTPDGVMAFNARTGKLEPASATPTMKAADSPALQGDIARAKKEGAGAGESNTAQFEAAQTASINLPKIDRLINHLQTSDAITGPAANVLTGLEMAKQLVTQSEAAGKKVTDTQIADILMGSEVFPLIKELGIGARGMDTPAEREFMRQVLTGTVALNKDTLVRMAQMRREAALGQINRWNERLSKGELEDFYRNTKRTREPLKAQPSVTTGGATPGRRRYNPETGALE